MDIVETFYLDLEERKNASLQFFRRFLSFEGKPDEAVDLLFHLPVVIHECILLGSFIKEHISHYYKADPRARDIVLQFDATWGNIDRIISALPKIQRGINFLMKTEIFERVTHLRNLLTDAISEVDWYKQLGYQTTAIVPSN